MAPDQLAKNRPAQVQPGAIVLTGGLSTRMGTDKASLVVGGQSMVDRVTSVLTEAKVSILAIAGSAEVPDPDPLQGPMAGIVAGWRHLAATYGESLDPVVVLSCDLPSLDAQVVMQLVAIAMGHNHGAVAHDGVRPQPLIAAYRPAALDILEQRYLDGQRSVRKCFKEWDLGTVQFDAAVLADADRPEDLEGFEVEWPS